MINEDRVYCSLCLEFQQSLGDKGHVSQVTNYAAITSSSGNLGLHLSSKHDVCTMTEAQNQKILGYFRRNENAQCSTVATSQQEITRDFVLWFCRDLVPFEAVTKDGLAGFSKKICRMSICQH